MPENSQKPYKLGLEKAISALPAECQNEPCRNVGHFLSITALNISKTSHLLFVTQTVQGIADEWGTGMNEDKFLPIHPEPDEWG